MPITNNNLPLIDLPVWEVLQPSQIQYFTYGSCMVTDPRGSSRFLYCLFEMTHFWRYDCWGNTWQQLNAPGSTSIGSKTCLAYDPSYGVAGGIWALIYVYGSSPYVFIYDIATNTWTYNNNWTSGIPSFITEAAMVHTCSDIDAGADDNALYVVGGGITSLYKHSLSDHSWSALPGTIPGAVGAGCRLEWVPGWDAGKLVLLRGGDTNSIYIYDIAAGTWETLSYSPDKETFGQASMSVVRGASQKKILIQKDYTGRIYELDLENAVLNPKATMLLPSNLNYSGNRMCYVKSVEGIEYLYLPTNSTSGNIIFMRTPLFF